MGLFDMFGGDSGGIGGDPYASKSAPLFDSMFGRNLDAESKSRRMMMGRALMSVGQGLASKQRGEHWASAATRGMSGIPGIIEDQQQRGRTAAFRERIGSMAEGETDPTRRAWIETLGMLDPEAAAGPMTSILGTGMQVGGRASEGAANRDATNQRAANKLAYDERKAIEDRAYDHLVETGRMTRSEANIASQEQRAADRIETQKSEGILDRDAAMARARAGNSGGFSNAEIKERNEVLAATVRAMEGTAGRSPAWIENVRGAEVGMANFEGNPHALTRDIRLAMNTFAGETAEEYQHRTAGIIGDPGSGYAAPPVPDVEAGEEPPVAGTIYRQGPGLYRFNGEEYELVTEDELAQVRLRAGRARDFGTEFPGQEYMR